MFKRGRLSGVGDDDCGREADEPSDACELLSLKRLDHSSSENPAGLDDLERGCSRRVSPGWIVNCGNGGVRICRACPRVI